MKDYSIGVETVAGETKAVLIGGGHISQKLSVVLNNRGLSCLIISNPKDLDLSTSPEFVFLFNEDDGKLPEIVLNFVESIKSKLIVVSIDRACGEKAIGQCLSRDIDFCSAAIYDLYGNGESGSALGKIFSEIRNQKVVTFKNDMIFITPVYIDDAVEGLCRIAFSIQTFKKNFLLTGKKEIPLVGFVQRVGTEASQTFGLLPKPTEYGQAYPETIARHEKILKRDESYLLLNWRPEVDLPFGIKSTLELLKTANKDQPEIKKKIILSP